MKVNILGCGSSNGVPYIGDRWGACDPANPKNRRTRPSVLVDVDGVRLLIDTTPDLREQLLRAGVANLDAVLWTHHHADHLHGLDDLREICRLMNRAVPAYGLAEHLDDVRQRFAYAFKPLPEGHSFYRPVLAATAIDGPFDVAGVRVIPFLQDHGWMTTVGYRIGSFAYSTDVVRLDEAAFETLQGIDLWVVDCVREEEHPVHSHLAQTLRWIERVGPKRAVLTHMSNSLDYDTLRAKLPPGVEPGYDGLEIEIP